jgi:hypothetical protein
MSPDDLLKFLQRDGNELSMIVGERWVGIRPVENGRWCVVSGPVNHPLPIRRHCYCATYDAAMDVFAAWWDMGFRDSPPGLRISVVN